MKRSAPGALLLLMLAAGAVAGAQDAPAAFSEPGFRTSTSTAAPIPAPTVALAAGAVSRAGTDDPIYLNLVWHQHQPLYYKDSEGVYTRPWARVHATKDYYDMAAMIADYPGVKVSFNLTPVLLRQLADFASGAKDRYQTLAEKDAPSLTDSEKRFILERFFDANRDNMILRFPRYAELLAKRGGSGAAEIDRAIKSFTVGDFRDLQVLFNLVWFDPDFLATEPLRSLVLKGRDFSEEDKTPLFAEARRITGEIVPLHRRLQGEGRIEVTTTPYAHPILPLVYNSDLTKKADPTGKAPTRFSWPNDAIAQLNASTAAYETAFGRPVRGLWPAEGAVSQDTVRITAKAGFSWMATGEQVLAKSLGVGSFSRDAMDTVFESDALYRPYYVEDGGYRMAVFFRDLRLSDLIGFEYSGIQAAAAASDFVARIDRIRENLKRQGAKGPHIVSVILDGENAWENYPMDGKAFLGALYAALRDSDTIRTVTPSEYLEMYPEQRSLDRLAEGCWFTSDYSTWIGEEEENLAWEYLGKVRAHLAKYDVQKIRATTPERLVAARDAMYLAEGSDWFWWYGDDQDSGVDEYFDEGFRALLKQVYVALGDEVPAFLDVPIIPKRAISPDKGFDAGKEPFEPLVDGITETGEWDRAGLISAPGGVQAVSMEGLHALWYGFGARDLYLRVDTKIKTTDFPEGSAIQIYIGKNGAPGAPFTENGTVLGYNALIGLSLDIRTGSMRTILPDKDGAWKAVAMGTAGTTGARAALGGSMAEAALPLEILGNLSPGDSLALSAYVASQAGSDSPALPSSGPLRAIVPDMLSVAPVLSVTDPEGDDHGPGSYLYPADQVFAPGVFDIETFEVAQNPELLAIKMSFRGGIDNVWNSGIGLSVQTIDVYIDRDPGSGSGGKFLLEGRNASLGTGFGWERAIWVEGWNQRIFMSGEDGNPKEMSGTVRVVVDASKRTVGITVPKAALGLGDDARNWAFAAVVLSQDGYPAPGVRRVRDINTGAPTQWRAGGAPADSNHTRIFDVAWPAGATPSQEEALSTYAEGSFPQVPMLTAR
ncbi:MAG: glucodextranase DOMON-like domain-containing protein [Rectinemataceae bacterium]